MFEIELLKKYSTARKYAKSEVVIQEGEGSPFSLYVILSGSVRVVKGLGTFEQSVVGILNKGDFFGEMSLFTKQPRAATVITAEEAVLLEVSQDNVYELIRANPKVFYEILKTLCMRVDELNSRVRSLGMR